MLNKLFRFITDSNYRFVVMASEGLLDFLSDEKYLCNGTRKMRKVCPRENIVS